MFNISVLLFFVVLIASVSGDELRFIAVGDWGVNSEEQVWVAEAMDVWCGSFENGCNFIMSLGDNFYGDYMTSVNDTRFDTHWRDIYTGENIKDLVWYISIGNHDSSISNSELYQVEFGETEPRWYLPWLWYDFYDMAGESLVHFVCIDSPSLLTFKHNVTEQRLWINNTIENSEGDWIIVFGHHPMFSAGRYPGYPRLHRDVEAIMEERGADMYICGHDHNMQHIQDEQYYSFDYVVNGASGRGLYEYTRLNERYMNERGKELLLFEESHGFTGITMNEERMLVEHYTYELNSTSVAQPLLVYNFTRVKV